jgi:transcriptional regulator with XRE-family HTH domain
LCITNQGVVKWNGLQKYGNSVKWEGTNGKEQSMQLGERLRELRLLRALTLLQLSQATGLSVSYLSDLERGRTTPSLETLEKLASVYDVPLGQLMASVDGRITAPEQELAPGLQKLLDEGVVDLPTARDLSRIELRGKRPQTADEWRELYFHLRTLMRPYLREHEEKRGDE